MMWHQTVCTGPHATAVGNKRKHTNENAHRNVAHCRQLHEPLAHVSKQPRAPAHVREVVPEVERHAVDHHQLDLRPPQMSSFTTRILLVTMCTCLRIQGFLKMPACKPGAGGGALGRQHQETATGGEATNCRDL